MVILHKTQSVCQIAGNENLQARIRQKLKGIGYEF